MTPDKLEQLKKAIENLRVEIVLGDDVSTDGIGPLSEQYFLLALSSLEQAEKFMSISHIHFMRGD